MQFTLRAASVAASRVQSAGEQAGFDPRGRDAEDKPIEFANLCPAVRGGDLTVVDHLADRAGIFEWKRARSPRPKDPPRQVDRLEIRIAT
jgi:hypothetical protein